MATETSNQPAPKGAPMSTFPESLPDQPTEPLGCPVPTLAERQADRADWPTLELQAAIEKTRAPWRQRTRP